MSENNIIVAIDFGSAFTGYTYSFKGKNKNEIYYGKFEGTGANIKTLNKVIINDSNELVNYGYSAEEHMKKGNLKQNEHFFERIKMNLYSGQYTIKAVNSSKEIKLVDLIYIILDYLKKEAIKAIISSSRGFEDEYKYNEESSKIRWVLTIPAIWDEKSKNIMMEAAEKAGIVNESKKELFFALEPEAASYYCANEMNVDDNLFNYPYIICDLGGGTGDIVCHERIHENGVEKINEKHVPEGGAFGSDEINKKFENQVLKVIFGDDLFDKLNTKFKESLKSNQKMKNFSMKYINFKNEINNFKESLDENNYLNESMNIDCSIAYSVCKGINIKEAIDNYNRKCRNGWKIEDYGFDDEDDKTISFPYKIIYDLTKDITEGISKKLLEIISKIKNTATIFYVGGFTNSEFVVKLIRKNIEQKYPNIKHIRPPQPGNAVIKGAIYYGLSPERIKSRKAKYSLGMNAYLDWEDKYKNINGKKLFDKEFGKYVCQNAFYNFISKDDDIPINNRVVRPMRLNNMGNGKYGGELIIYKSPKIKTLLIDEEGVDEIGRFRILVEAEKEYNLEERIFNITMDLGGTFLNATAYHEKSGTKVNMEFKY